MKLIIIVLTYTFGGLVRGAALYGLSTVIINMLQDSSKISFVTTNVVISLLSTGCSMGSIVGTIIGPKIIQKMGQIKALQMVSLITLTVNILMFPSIHWVYLFGLKIISGVSSVLLLTIIPLICMQHVDSKLRGIVGSLSNLNMWASMFICNIIQYFICQSSKLYPISQIYPTVISVVMTIMSYIVKEQVKEQQKFSSTIKNESVFQKQFKTCFIVAFSLGMSLGSTGFTPILQYSTLIFKNNFSSPKSGTIGAIITSGISLMSCILALPFVKKYKRKLLICLGQNTMMICYIVMITVLYLQLNQAVSDTIILVTTIIYVIAYSFSTGSLFFVMMGEIYPPAIKSVFVNLTMGIHVTTLLIVTFVFPLLSQQQNYIIYFIWVLLDQILIIKYVPETHNKKMEEITQIMIYKEHKITKQELILCQVEVHSK
ncbi:Sugar_(And other) transporter family protein [Hexamita inflata]|uniref:Sugar_(And other) transporter family protein n=1 Tax=Hexamita inflata TaxID=28002 RepID=A0ABP1GSI2_9EUKA